MMTADTPLLLLDVDGVLNALKGLYGPKPEGWEQGRFNDYTITWDPTITCRLASWHENDVVEIQWLTTWCEDADRLLAEPMNLPRGLVVHREYMLNPKAPLKFSMQSEWWKFTHVKDIVNEQPGRRIVWIDDDHDDIFDPTPGDFIRVNPQVLAVKPIADDGVTHAQLDRVAEWIAEGYNA